jgi:FAD/FMN-containing dehydrogenase
VDGTEEKLLAALAAAIGPAHVLTGAEADAYRHDWRGIMEGAALAVLRPGDTEEVAACVRLCAEAGIAIVPQGGNTGLCGGATPADGEIVLSLARLNRVRDVDATDMTVIAEAGVTLHAAREAASAAGMDLPLSISSAGSAQIGGILATNAGGSLTLRHGNARALVLGLEVVLADGSIWNGLRRLRKDNTGYALAPLFVGSEGTLGIITAACLRLVPASAAVEVAFAAVPTPEAALALLGQLRRADESALTAFEYISGHAFRMLLAQIEGTTDPLPTPYPHYVLAECSATRAGPATREMLEAALAAAMEAGFVTDAVIAGSDSQRATLWRLREEQAEAQRRAGENIKNDISVPISAIPAFLRLAEAACAALMPGLRIVPFGHLGDGNIHFNVVAPAAGDAAAFESRADAIMHAVSEVARGLGGSFSAEHGIGQLKTGLLAEWRGGVELDLMRRLKAALDPAGVLNPGKVLG